MQLNRAILSGRRKYLFGLAVLLFISAIFAAFGMADNSDFDIARREVLLRRIGHELLLQSGDSTSRVLPVKKIAENEYQISFERAFTFQPGSLVNITQRLLDKAPLASDYVVNVLNCENAGVTYGYAISKNKKNDIVSCIGRRQPKACYMINIKFRPTVLYPVKNGLLLSTLPILAFIGFICLRSSKPKRVLPEDAHNDVLTLGTALFDTKNRRLTVNQKCTELTGTEARLLLILAQSLNETIERSRLQKEIWEDEGVIVGRSLDMFISKLRKKLECDPGAKITVVRGKGYKLEVNS